MGFESYDSQLIFGAAVRIVHVPQANAQQIDSFMGVNGSVALFGGSRGRTFEITGVFVGASLIAVVAAESVLLSYADGIARTLVDPIGRSFPNVIFEGVYMPNAEGTKPTDFGYCLPYRCVFRGLT